MPPRVRQVSSEAGRRTWWAGIKFLCPQIHFLPQLCATVGLTPAGGVSRLPGSWVWPVGGTFRGLEGRRKGEATVSLLHRPPWVAALVSSYVSSVAAAPCGEPLAVVLVSSANPQRQGSADSTHLLCPSQLGGRHLPALANPWCLLTLPCEFSASSSPGPPIAGIVPSAANPSSSFLYPGWTLMDLHECCGRPGRAPPTPEGNPERIPR